MQQQRESKPVKSAVEDETEKMRAELLQKERELIELKKKELQVQLAAQRATLKQHQVRSAQFILQCFGSGSGRAKMAHKNVKNRVADPDPSWIRIQSGQWIQVQLAAQRATLKQHQVRSAQLITVLRIGLILVVGWIQIQEGKNHEVDPKNTGSEEISSFDVLKGFHFSMDVLYGGLGINIF